MFRRMISIVITAAVSLNMLTIMPLNVSAEAASHTYTYENYEVEYAVLNEWEGNQSIKITVRNTGTESILNWAVAYRAGGEINGLWNAVSPKENIIKNAGYNYEIVPNGSVSFGYTLSGENLELPEKFEIVSKRANVTEGYEVKFDIYDDWGDGFQGAVTITNTGSEPLEAWTLSFDANFTIGNSWGGRIIDSTENSYTIASEMWTNPIMPNSSSSFGFTAAKEADTKAAADNFVLTSVIIDENAVPENPNEDIDYELDTDKDGLPDYYEDILGTDKNKEDTDGDGLSDGYEVLYLGTDPLKKDTDGNGINDGDEDLDKDGLTNIKECELGTDPNTADTDGDGLSDGAEANTHGTDPLKYDTDGDNVSDGDEITLGLDPNSSSTDGIPDSERTFTQTVSSDSEVLSAVNDDKETPFKVSLEIKAAGVAENNVYARESGYSNAIENSAIIGIAPEFVYTDGLSVEEVTVKFELENSVINNTLGTYTDESYEFKGIKRLNVFMFFEDVNMLLPVETFHDEATNTVYTKTDRMGTYCLVDMELWLDLLGIKLKAEKSADSVDKIDLMAYNGNEINSNSNEELRDGFNLVFVIDTCSTKTYDEFKLMKNRILDISRTVLRNSPNARIYFMSQNTSLTSDEHYYFYSDLYAESTEDKNGNKLRCNYFTDYAHIEKVLKTVTCTQSDISKIVLSDALEGINAECDLTRETFVFSIFNQENVMYRSSNGYDILDDVVVKGVDISVIAEIDNSKKYGYAHDMYKKSGGIFISDTDSDYSETALKHIYGKNVSEEEDTGEYNMILATGFSTVKLNAPITEEYAMLAAAGEIDETQPDTDEDGLPDYMEINFKAKNNLDQFMITFTNGIVRLPTYGECIQCKSGLTYVEQGLNRYEGEDIDPCSEVYTRLVLPINSDPTDEDGDKDGLPDGNDPVMLSCYNNGAFRENFTEANLKNVELYYWINRMYNDPTVRKDEHPIEFYYNHYNVKQDQAENTSADTVILQKCLEFLGYLDMTNYEYNGFGQLINVSKTPYGTLGGLTKAAVKLYQSNHKLDYEHIIENDIVDDTTFYSVILAAMNYGYEFNELEKKYCNQAETYFDDVYEPKSFPMNTIDDIPVVKKVTTLHNEIYLYDLTTPFNKILQHGAQEFHAASYDCDLKTLPVYPSSVIKTYSDCGKICEYDSIDLIWLCGKVKNNAKYDIKTKESWHDLFHIVNYDFMFYGSKYPFVYNGNEINAEQFGNILFGFCCNAGAYPLWLISSGGSIYSLISTGQFDNTEDTEMVKKGYEMFDEYSDNYNFLHGVNRNEEH